LGDSPGGANMRLRSLPFPLGGAIVVAFVGALLYVRPSSKYLRVKSTYRTETLAARGLEETTVSGFKNHFPPNFF
jgi:hypothetical protein